MDQISEGSNSPSSQVMFVLSRPNCQRTPLYPQSSYHQRCWTCDVTKRISLLNQTTTFLCPALDPRCDLIPRHCPKAQSFARQLLAKWVPGRTWSHDSTGAFSVRLAVCSSISDWSWARQSWLLWSLLLIHFCSMRSLLWHQTLFFSSIWGLV